MVWLDPTEGTEAHLEETLAVIVCWSDARELAVKFLPERAGICVIEGLSSSPGSTVRPFIGKGDKRKVQEENEV